MMQVQTLSALFSIPGFHARSRLQGIFGDPHARLVTLVRRKKLPCARAAGRGGLPPGQVLRSTPFSRVEHPGVRGLINRSVHPDLAYKPAGTDT